MKKIIVFAILLIISITVFAQEDDLEESITDANELKINMSNLIGFKWLDLGYERILNEESSIGVGILFGLDSETDLNDYRSFSLTPYYRHFFSKKYAQGFFLEAFTMLHSGTDLSDDYYLDGSDDIFIEGGRKYTDFAVGISAGAKFLSRRGFVAEIYAGIGRDLLNNSGVEVVGRGGISIGYRF